MCLYTCIYVHMSMYIYTDILYLYSISIHLYSILYLSIYTCIDIHVSIYTYTYKETYMYTDRYLFTYIKSFSAGSISLESPD